MNKTPIVFFLTFFIFLLPVTSFASIGVGVATGKIIVEEDLRPGATYTLPNLAVLNTGDEVTTYSVGIEYKENIEELRPPAEWFSMKPLEFVIQPGGVDNVNVELTIPIKAQPGDYFAFISAFPVIEKTGGSTVNIAAASKLYFTVAPSNFFQGVYYKVIGLLSNTAPWSYIVLGIIALWWLIRFIKRKFKIRLKFDVGRD